MRKRVLSLLLAICLVMGMLPPTALATEGGTPTTETPSEVALELKAGSKTAPYTVSWSETANKVFYAKTADNGSSVEDVTSAVEADANTAWNIKLDNTKTVAELTLKNATLSALKNMGSGVNVLKVTGAGALKVIVEGNNSLTAGYGPAFSSSMALGTTITSDGTGKLKVELTDSGSYIAMPIGAGDLTLENVNVEVIACSQNQWGGGGIDVKAGNMYVKGGSLKVTGKNESMRGIVVKQALSISDGAKVTLEHTLRGDALAKQRYNSHGIEAASVNFSGALLEIKNTSGNWSRVFNRDNDNAVMQNKMISVMPTTNGIPAGDSIEIVYSANDADGSDAAPVAGNEDAALISKYIRFKYVCGSHDYGTDPSNPTCIKCGEGAREVAKDITVTMAGITWNATAGQTYYATTNASGVVTNLNTTAPADDSWNIKLDNTKPVAELTLKGAKVAASVDSDTGFALTASGEGALKIIVAEASSVTNKGFAMKLDMAGGTTITSLNNSLLTVTSSVTNGRSIPFYVTRGSIHFEKANVYTSNAQKNGSNRTGAITTLQGEVIIDNSTIEHKSNECSAIFIDSKTTVTIRNFSKITATNEKGTPSYQNSGVYYRFSAIQVGGDNPGSANTITIDSSTVEIINKGGCWRRMFNVAPTITGATTKYSPDDYAGNSLQDLTDAAVLTTVDACKYVLIEAICDPHVYDNDNPYDYNCNNCGYIRTDVPRDVTVHVVTDGGVKQTTLTEDYDRTVTVPAGEVYYGITNGDGLVTDFKKYDAEPAEWSFMLDNRGPEALLVFNNAKLTKTGADYSDANGPIGLLSVSGAGALKIVLRGTSTFTSGYGQLLRTAMTGGTTYTSENGGKLNLVQAGTSVLATLSETVGKLTFDHANVDANNTRYSTSKDFRQPIIKAATDMEVIGGKLNLTANDTASKVTSAVVGITVGGKLTLRDYAIVSVEQNSTKEDAYTHGATYPRHGVTATEIEINDATLYILDKTNKFDYAINMMPTLTGNVKAYQGANVDGSDRQEFTSADGTIEYAYVAFVYDCNGQHDFTDAYDAECNKCGEIREVPRDITATFAYQTTGNGTLYDFTWNVPAGKVYYAKTDADGVFTNLGELAADPDEWNIKLDNTQPTAVLTLHNAYLKKAGQSDRARDFNAISVVGEGALQIVVDGNSTIETEFNIAIKTSMGGGTTYTSLNNSLLTVTQNGTSGISGISEALGTLTFNNANVTVNQSRYTPSSSGASPAISAAADMNVINSRLNVIVVSTARTAAGSHGIKVGGALNLSDYSQVTVKHTAANGAFEGTRYGVNAGSININRASLRVVDNANMFTYSVNIAPNLTDVNGEYSENADGTGAVALPQDATFPVDYPYVGFIFDCVSVNGAHDYTDDADADCGRCGYVRNVPRDVNFSVTTDGGDKNKTLAEALHEVTVKANEVYYAVADDKGFITEFTTTEPENWDIMLDNRNPVAKLVFANNAYLYKSESHGKNLLSISGEGALEIIIRSNARIKSGALNVLVTSMGLGTKYISEDNSKLTVEQIGTGLSNAIVENTGNLTFDHANLYVTHNSENNQWPSNIITAAKDMKVIGGQLNLVATNYSIRGIVVSGDLSLSDYAIVTVKQTSTSTKEFIGVTGRPEGQKQYRYGVSANGDFTIDNASLTVNDNTSNMFEYAVNKMPDVTGNTKPYYSESTDGSNLQTLAPADGTIEYPYVAFVYDCGGEHTYTDQGDPDCNKCGEVRIVPYPITVTITNLVSKVLPDGKQVIWNAAVGQIYYASTDDKGVVTDLGTTDPGDGNWNIKLDNSKPTAELTFRNATIKMDGASGLAQKNSAIKVAGEGTLKIIIDGNSSVTSGYNHTLRTEMKGGTTYTSVNNGKLTLNQSGTSGQTALSEGAGTLTFKDANIRATNNRNHNRNATATISGSYDVIVSGGSLEIESLNCSTQGLTVGGNLKLTDWAKVKLIAKTSNHTRYEVGTAAVRHAVKVNGEFVIDNASLRVTDSINSWDAAVNKSPNLIGGTAKYSENADGTNLQTLTPADPAAAVEYPYVAYVINCAEHIWDNDADPDCNRCGEIRAVPYDIQVLFQYGTAELLSVAWDAKVGEVYYATTNASGQVTDLGKKDSEPSNWTIKLDNTGAEAVLTLRSATIIRKVRPKEAFEQFNIGAGALGTITVQGKGALRIVCEKATTITTDEAYESIITSMGGGTTYESKNNAKLTLTGKSTATCGGIKETIGNLIFENANVSVKIQKTSTKYTSTTVSCPHNMTVIGGKVEIIGAGYATNALNVKGDLLVKDNGILIVTTGSSPSGGNCATKPYGMKVDGDITVENATLMVKKYGGAWSYLINKMPTLVGAEAYISENSTKESKLTAFSKDAGTDMTELAPKFFYFSNAKPGTLDDSAMEEEEEEEDDDFIFEDFDNPFTGDTVNLTLLFVLVMTSAAALVVLFSKKRSFRE